MNRYYDTIHKNETHTESDSTIISTDDRVKEFFKPLPKGYSLEFTDDNLPLIVKIPEKTEQEKDDLAKELLKSKRNSLLSVTDWWASSDLTMTQEQKDYRKALRDLPSTASPKLDENGELTNVTWPTKPKEAE